MTKSLFLFFFTLFNFHLATAQTWKTYTFAKGNFKIDFPAKPDEQIEGTEVYLRAEFNATVFQVVAHTNKKFNLANAEMLLEESIKGFYNPKTDKMDRKTSGKFQNYPYKEVWLSTGDNEKIVFRTLITTDRLYQFVISKKQQAVDETTIKQFIDSFSFIK